MSGSGQIRQKAEAGDWGHAALNFWDNDYEALRQIVQAMKPAKVENAGTAYEEMSARMRSSMDLLRKQAQALAEAWKGDPADAALTKLRDLNDAAFQIQSKSSDTGAALKDHAATQRKWQSTVKEEKWYGVEVGTGKTGVGDWLQGESHMGRELMQQMQRDTVESNERFPAELQAKGVSVDASDFKPIEDNGKGGENGGSGAGGASAGARTPSGVPGSQPPVTPGGSDSFGNGGHLIGGSGSGGGAGSVPTSGTGVGSADGVVPGPVIGSDTGLAGFNPAGGSAAGTGTGVGALGGAGVGGVGTGPGGGAFAGPGGVGAMGGLGAGVLGTGSTSGGTSGTGAGRGGMMPMAPQTGQQDEKERERSTWLTEDDDVWNSGDGTTPPVIG